MIITIGYSILTANLVNNPSVDALKELLKESPLTIEMDDYNKMEKVGSIGTSLPQNNIPLNTGPGDIILYQGDKLAIYYNTNSYSLTPIGKIEDITQDELKKILGDGSVSVTLSLANYNYENGPRTVGSKLSKGAIAGIAVACIVFVAGIMIGEYFIVKHFLNKKTALSINEDNKN